MSQKTKEEMLPRLRHRYKERGRRGRSVMLDEFCEQWQCNRKHAIKLLNGKFCSNTAGKKRRGRPITYNLDVTNVLEAIWIVADQPCGKRMKALMPTWLPYYKESIEAISSFLEKQLLGISAAQIDRLLTHSKVKNKRGKCATRPGSLLKNQIPIRTDNWDITCPGYLEADTVAHCGTSLEGDFIWTVNYTDIYSG